jgi:light-regulated signal transduction histidine kinase (bacteriophytochrome)
MSTETTLDAPVLSLANCADEPIHVPGTVQRHGAMLAPERNRPGAR